MTSILDLKAENNRLKRKIEKLQEELEFVKSMPLDYDVFVKLFEKTGIGVVIHDFDEILYVNETVMKNFNNVPPDFFIGKNPMLFVPPEYHATVLKRFELLKSGQPVEAIEETYILPSGQVIDVNVGSFPIMHKGKICALLTISDLTKQKKISAENELLLDVMENVPLSLIITDKNLKIEYVNSYFLKISGFSKKEIIGNTPAFALGQNFSKEFLFNIYKKVSGGGVWREC